MKLCFSRFVLLSFLALALVAGPATSAVWASEKAEASAEKGGHGEKGGEKADKGKKGGGDEEITGGSSANDPFYVHVVPINVPMMGNDGVEQLVTIRVAVQVKSRDAADTVRSKMPILQDTIMSTLYGGFGNGSLRSGAVIDIDKAKVKIARALNKKLAEKPIEDVLISGLEQRRL